MKCICGSGMKYKKCCKESDSEEKEIKIKVEMKILFNLLSHPEIKNDLIFSKDGITMEIDEVSNKIIAVSHSNVSGLVEKTLLKSYYSIQEMEGIVPSAAIEEINNLSKRSIDAINDLVIWLDLVLFINHQGELVNNVEDFIYDPENDEWIKFPMDLKGIARISRPYVLTDIRKKYIQNEMNEGEMPFKAFAFLKHAKLEKDLSIKWITATIAAELAIKEFYMRFDDKLEYIVTEMPSPPLGKLYNGMLQAVAGCSNTKYKELDKGATTRNKLVHSPKNVELKEKDVNKYIHDVETAIFELVEILDKNSQLSKDYRSWIKNKEDTIKKMKENGFKQIIVDPVTQKEATVTMAYE